MENVRQAISKEGAPIPEPERCPQWDIGTLELFNLKGDNVEMPFNGPTNCSDSSLSSLTLAEGRGGGVLWEILCSKKKSIQTHFIPDLFYIHAAFVAMGCMVSVEFVVSQPLPFSFTKTVFFASEDGN